MKKRVIGIRLAVVLIFALLLSGCSASGSASASSWTVEGMQSFYRGKTIYLSTNERPGSESESVCRLTVPLFGDYTKATIVLQNKRSSGGVEGLNWVYERPDPYGLEIGECVLLNLLLNKITELPGANYDSDAFNYLFGISSEKFVFMVKEGSKYQSIKDLQAASKLKFGGTSAQGPIALSTMSSAAILGLDAKVITGFGSTGELILSILSGELDGVCVPIHLASSADGVKVLFTLSSERDPIFPDVPALTELMDVPADKQDLFELWNSLLLQSHIFFTSPKVNTDNLEFLRGMAGAVAGNEILLSDISRLLSLPIVPGDVISGEKMQAIVADTMKNASRIKSILEDVIKKYRA